MPNSQVKIETIRHSLSHIMAFAVGQFYPDVKFGIGPAIENGFYYDFDFNKSSKLKAQSPKPQLKTQSISEEDLLKIEKKMRQLIKQNLEFTKKEISKKEALTLFKNQQYKIELIKGLSDDTVTIYQNGDFTDLCAGPHINSTKEIDPKAFKLTKLSGAYWRGDEKNQMLTRIYGVAFDSERELTDYLHNLEEAEKRDHRKIGTQLDLFSFHEQAPGMPFFHPKGTIVYNLLYEFWRNTQKKFNYDFVIAPSMLDTAIWKKSGHWDHYKDDMYFTTTDKNEKQYALRPMDCPGAIIIYNDSPKSYRNLPLRYAEPGLITRKEKSGQLGGLFRVQQFKQDDAHIFITESQIENEIKQVIKLVDEIYQPFGLSYMPYLSTRPDDFMGDIASWNKAEVALKKILNDVYGQDKWGLKEKDGAFYGPKIDYQLKDSLSRTWQCATIQLDFQMPLKFDCKYSDKDGKEKTPVLIHRTIMGSFERFMGILLEHYAGALPLWLAPEQIWVAPIGEKHLEYARQVTQDLMADTCPSTLRVKLIDANETIGKKIREAQLQKIPYVLVVGDKEVASKTVAVRHREQGDLGTISLEKFLERVKMELINFR